jgi:hypothetical protein
MQNKRSYAKLQSWRFCKIPILEFSPGNFPGIFPWFLEIFPSEFFWLYFRDFFPKISPDFIGVFRNILQGYQE